MYTHDLFSENVEYVLPARICESPDDDDTDDKAVLIADSSEPNTEKAMVLVITSPYYFAN
jgi:hypothetical protein